LVQADRQYSVEVPYLAKFLTEAPPRQARRRKRRDTMNRTAHRWTGVALGLLVAAGAGIGGCERETPTANKGSATAPAADGGAGSAGAPARVPDAAATPPPAPAGDDSKASSKESPAAALDLWQSGKQEQAADVFVKTRWRESPRAATSMIGDTTEQRFKELPPDAQTAKRQELMAKASTLRDLSRFVLDEGKRAMAAGDYAKSERYFTAVRDAGKSISDQRDLAQLARQVGTALERAATTELTALEHVKKTK
jgi:hypothetical protein